MCSCGNLRSQPAVRLGCRSLEATLAALPLDLVEAIAERVDDEASLAGKIDKQVALARPARRAGHPAHARASDVEAAFTAARCRCQRQTAAARAIRLRASGGSTLLRASFPSLESCR
jgi:hypothetical protein